MPGRRVGAVLATSAVVVLSSLVPQAASRLAELPGDGAVRLLYAGERPTEAGLLRVLDSREAALAWVERAGPHRDLGHFYFVLADELGDTEERRRTLLLRAEAELTTAMARSPADPPTLALLATTYVELDRPEQARRWLEVAQRIAPFSPETALVRAWIALTTAPPDDPPRPTDARDFRAAFAYDRARFVQMVMELGARDRVLPAFAGTEADYELRVALMRAEEDRLDDSRADP
ncbi:MAG: tetratricopeptide repeat protein [Geminicoccaceae bacterium]